MIDIEINTAPVGSALALAAGVLQAPRDALDAVGHSIASDIRLNFDSGQDAYGARWEPLSDRSRSGQPLRDTGRLRNSLTHEASDTEVRIGTNVCYAPAHQFGATIKAGLPPHQSMCGYMTKGAPLLRWFAGGAWHAAKSVTVPARPFLPDKGLPPDMEQNAIEAVASALNAALEPPA